MATFDSRGFPIYYETHGSGDGIPLVLLMGIGGTCQGWVVVTVPETSHDRMNVVFDNRGAGRSGDPGSDFTSRDLAEDALALLDELDIPRAHLLGGMLGGLAAQEFAIHHPDRVQSLILVGSFAKADARRRMLFEQWITMAELDLPLEYRVKDRLIWSLHDLTFEHEDLIEAILGFYRDDDVPMEEKAYVRQLRSCIEHDTLDRLERIEAPTLVVCGEQDILTPPHMHRQLANRIPNARLVQIRGAGHLVTAETARRFNRLVNRFLLEYDG